MVNLLVVGAVSKSFTVLVVDLQQKFGTKSGETFWIAALSQCLCLVLGWLQLNIDICQNSAPLMCIEMSVLNTCSLKFLSKNFIFCCRNTLVMIYIFLQYQEIGSAAIYLLISSVTSELLLHA